MADRSGEVMEGDVGAVAIASQGVRMEGVEVLEQPFVARGTAKHAHTRAFETLLDIGTRLLAMLEVLWWACSHAACPWHRKGSRRGASGRGSPGLFGGLRTESEETRRWMSSRVTGIIGRLPRHRTWQGSVGRSG